MQWRTPPSPRARKSPVGFIVPCQPTASKTVPTGPEWVHEIKHDGFRLVARKDADKVQLWSRQGRSWAREFAAITAALKALPVTQIVLDGEAVAHGPDGLPDFSRLLSGDGWADACFFAFDVLMLGGDDLRPLPLSIRRNMLAELPLDGTLQFSEHMAGPDGEAMFRHACAMGLEGIISKRADKPYRSPLPGGGVGLQAFPDPRPASARATWPP